MLEELEGKAAQTVPGGHHNLCESSLVCCVQKGQQTLAPPVDARADVGDELVARELGEQEVCLPLHVVFLLGGGHAGVDDFLFLVGWLLLVTSLCTVGQLIEADPPGGPAVLDLPGVCPSPQGLWVDGEPLGVLCRLDIHYVH